MSFTDKQTPGDNKMSGLKGFMAKKLYGKKVTKKFKKKLDTAKDNKQLPYRREHGITDRPS